MVLMIISFLLLVIRITFPYVIKPDPIIIENLPLIERKLDSMKMRPGSQSSFKVQNLNIKTPNLRFFNPNKVTYEALLDMGFREKTAQTFLKFREKGFVFRKKEDVLKIYGITQEHYLLLEPYIVLEKEKQTLEVLPASVEKKEVSKALLKIELNSADSVNLMQLKGIGSSYARRIVKYRNALGGFSNIEQLKEVYGLSEVLFDQIKKNIWAASDEIITLDPNLDDFKTLNKHPYLSYEMTKMIFNRRKQGAITETVIREILGDEELFKKLRPYLKFD
jgi:competence protein ComEA